MRIALFIRFLLLFALTLSLVSAIGCVSPKIYLDDSVLHQSPEFGSETFSGATIYISPLLTSRGFDTSSAIGVARQIEILKRARPDLNIVETRSFIAAFNQTHNPAMLEKFFRNMYLGNVIPVQNSDTVWHALDGKYLIVMNQKASASIKSFENRTKKRLRLETEIWDISNQETVWREAINAYTLNPKVTDVELIWQAIINVYKKIPSFVPSLNETSW